MQYNIRLPHGSKFESLTFPCNQVVNNHGEHCGRLVFVSTHGLDLDEIQSLLDDEIHDRCTTCREKHLKQMAQDAANEI